MKHNDTPGPKSRAMLIIAFYALTFTGMVIFNNTPLFWVFLALQIADVLWFYLQLNNGR